MIVRKYPELGFNPAEFLDYADSLFSESKEEAVYKSNPIEIYFTSKNPSIPKCPPSQPRPLSL
jgi:hypothetical protein